MDLSGGLTQVLADGASTYLYSLGRIAQYGPGGAEYFQGDALGSLRQLVDAQGAVVLAKSYLPYGEVLESLGTGVSRFGFASEWQDDLIYLRARFYAPSTGRFLTRDPFPGVGFGPQSFNGYTYAMNNPVIYRDASGECPPCWLLALLGLALTTGCTGGPTPAPTPPFPFPAQPGPAPSAPIVLPNGFKTPPSYPPKIKDDPILLEGIIWLYNSSEGKQYAEHILRSNISFVWVEGSSGSVMSCAGEVCSFQGEIRISDIRNDPNPGRAITLAGIIGHEAYHSTQPFGQVKGSFHEEFHAYNLQDRIMRELGNDQFMTGDVFDGYDPNSGESLKEWMSRFHPEYEEKEKSGKYTVCPPPDPRVHHCVE